MAVFNGFNKQYLANLVKNLRERLGFGRSVTREKAHQIAIKYLGEQMSGRIKISSSLPANIYNRARLKGSWVVRVPSHSGQQMTGPTRVICICRKTGKIDYDGSDGGE